MNEQLTDIEVAEFADFPYTPAERKLAREVQASRKLIADLRALRYHAIDVDLIVQMIEEAGL